MWNKRFYLVSGSCMYYYSSDRNTDIRPKGVIFLAGSIVESFRDEENELKGYYGFEILHQDLCTGEHHRHDKRVMYASTAESRDKWVTTLQHAAHVIPIEDDYVIGMCVCVCVLTYICDGSHTNTYTHTHAYIYTCVGKELGRGRFSVVCECVHKVTNRYYAVKIIDKTTIEQEDKGLLRTEIAVLKLVNHPNIIHMEGLYESRQNIYIVMEKLNGGELFERIVGRYVFVFLYMYTYSSSILTYTCIRLCTHRPRFSEVDAAKIIRPLFESVAYLHDLGTLHRSPLHLLYFSVVRII